MPKSATPADTPYRIAKIAGLSISHTARVLKRETHARFDTAVKIAQAAGITLDELAERVYGTDPELTKAVASIERRRKQWRSQQLQK